MECFFIYREPGNIVETEPNTLTKDQKSNK